jgi:hypothetical protein
MKWNPCLSVIALMMLNATAFVPPATAAAGVPEANYDEAKMPPYVLPELLKNGDGSPVVTAADWTGKRRPELLALFESKMFGRAPERPALAFEVQEEATPALDGKALRKQVKVFLTGKKEGPGFSLLIYTPAVAAQKPVPFFLGLNFEGNPSVLADPKILPRIDPKPGDIVNGKPAPAAKPAEPGSQSTRWQVEWLISQGYGTATAWYWDIDPDYDDGFKNGVHALYPDIEKSRSGEAWGSLAGWAWGLRVAMDYLEKEPLCDAAHVALHGHSRLGKAALWAGANDSRFSIVISNESGCGGAALSKRIYGETVGRINTSFPHWFCSNYHQWNQREQDMPFDQHELLALIAPRALFVGSAEGDQWADPTGERLALEAAAPAFFLTCGDAKSSKSPLLQAKQAYFIRPGKHDVMDSDWQAWVDFARTVWK